MRKKEKEASKGWYLPETAQKNDFLQKECKKKTWSNWGQQKIRFWAPWRKRKRKKNKEILKNKEKTEKKKRKKECRNDKPLKNENFCSERRTRMCGFLGSKVPYRSLRNQRSRPVSHKAAHIFPQAISKVVQNVDYSPGKTGEPPARDLRETCEGLILRKRELFFRTVMKREERSQPSHRGH